MEMNERHKAEDYRHTHTIQTLLQSVQASKPFTHFLDVTDYYFFHFCPDFNVQISGFYSCAHMDSDLGDGDGGKSVCNMLIDSASAFRWVIFHYTALHRVVMGTQHTHAQTNTTTHTPIPPPS